MRQSGAEGERAGGDGGGSEGGLCSRGRAIHGAAAGRECNARRVKAAQQRAGEDRVGWAPDYAHENLRTDPPLRLPARTVLWPEPSSASVRSYILLLLEPSPRVFIFIFGKALNWPQIILRCSTNISTFIYMLDVTCVSSTYKHLIHLIVTFSSIYF